MYLSENSMLKTNLYRAIIVMCVNSDVGAGFETPIHQSACQ